MFISLQLIISDIDRLAKGNSSTTAVSKELRILVALEEKSVAIDNIASLECHFFHYLNNLVIS